MEKALKLENNKLYKAKWKSFELFRLLDEEDMNHCIDRMKVLRNKDNSTHYAK